jgi:hypothetical protein
MSQVNKEKNISSPEVEIKKDKTWLWILISVVATVLVAGFFIYFITANMYSLKVKDLNHEIERLESELAKRGVLSVYGVIDALPSELIKTDEGSNLEPTDGYMLVTSIKSNNGDKVVYLEISESINQLDSYEDWWTSWTYSIYVKDLGADELLEIYSGPGDKITSNNFFIKKAQAGGCPLMYLPVAWTKNDKKIVFEMVNPTNCGSGGATEYKTFTIDPLGGSILKLATFNAIFIDTYSKVVDADRYKEYIYICNSMDSFLKNSIIVKDVEKETSRVLLSDNYSSYELKSVDVSNNAITYTEKKYKQSGNCVEIDESIPEQVLQLNLN